jgi:hypothetical protein
VALAVLWATFAAEARARAAAVVVEPGSAVRGAVVSKIAIGKTPQRELGMGRW